MGTAQNKAPRWNKSFRDFSIHLSKELEFPIPIIHTANATVGRNHSNSYWVSTSSINSSNWTTVLSVMEKALNEMVFLPDDNHNFKPFMIFLCSTVICLLNHRLTQVTRQ
jgi:hypothetical protein